MGRMVRDPWAKKSVTGMRTLSKMVSTAYKVGKSAYKSSSQNSSYHIPQQQQPQKIEWTTGVGLLCGGAVLLIIILNSESLLIGYLLGLVAMVVSTIIFTLILESIRKKITTRNITESISPVSSSEVADMTIACRIKDAIVSNQNYSDISGLCKSLSLEKKKATFSRGLDEVVAAMVDTGSVPEHTEEVLNSIADAMGVSINDFRDSSSWVPMVKMLVIDDLLHGKKPDRIHLSDIPLNLQKNETIIWCFVDVRCFESREKRVNYGVSKGTSIRIAKGLYYHIGAFKREPFITTEQRFIAFGQLFLTNKNIYFYSEDKSIRVPYSKIVAYTPYEDGLGIQKDAATVKPMNFVGIDGWFAYNIVKNIHNIE